MRLLYTIMAAASTAGALLLAGCSNKDAAAPDLGNDYYPVVVGTYRAYQVNDTVWANAVAAVPAPYQVREAITGTYTDAAGQLAYRVEHARRATASAAWAPDSTFALSVTPNAVVLNRGNRRTVEAVFPVRENYLWNFNAYQGFSSITLPPADTVNAQNRRYDRVGQALTVPVAGGTARAYDATATVSDAGAAAADDQCNLVGYQQVLARGVGPVLRRRVSLSFQVPGAGACVRNGYRATSGAVHRETLIDAGKL
ncbi:hypothetical protein ACFQ48_15090 [Hymenobacter caeli]|uniref:Lipoprotein n=1 Tax=Hymenobacter caeli TaxID=2735894 RepID=A0ABX2FRA5_9BACT|nr:hypothetical protein [Hymenobacter caeli]NRT19649.1 hypothetical protein [Hymenobacter caeli]